MFTKTTTTTTTIAPTTPDAFTFPSLPPFTSRLRLARRRDVRRMAEIFVGGFRESEIFKFERPRFDEYPEDAMASVRNMLRDQLADPGTLMVVAEEACTEDMNKMHDADTDGTKDGFVHVHKIVVGVARWVLSPNSNRWGQFLLPDGDDDDSSSREKEPDRDLDADRLALVNTIKMAGEKRYFAGMHICDKLVVDPAFWGRGHGSELVSWGLRLSDVDGVDQGVMPSYAGEPLFLRLGFVKIDTLQVPDRCGAKGFHISVATYCAKDKRWMEAWSWWWWWISAA